MTTSSEPFPQEGAEPDQRVWALFNAKRILDMRPPFGRGEISVIELVDVSEYILWGAHPRIHISDAVT